MNEREVVELFDFHHLPEGLQAMSKPFFIQAMEIAGMTNIGDGVRQIALTKLLEAKDAVVRCHAIKARRDESNQNGVRVDLKGN